MDWHVAGTYLESCNCEAICPCRRIGGRSGGRSTFGECLGTLCWRVEQGHADDVDLSGLGIVLALHYSDDEPGSPWTYFLYLDERASAEQFAALTAIFTGEAGGTPELQFPWVYKPSNLLAVKPIAIEIDHTPGRGWFRAGDQVTVRVREPVADQEPVTCLIPGHDRGGRELYADTLAVHDVPLNFEFSGRCAYEATFEYSSDDR
jgi:hypothetical protein